MRVLTRAAVVYLGATLASAGCGPDETNGGEQTIETTTDIDEAIAAPYGAPPIEETPPVEETPPAPTEERASDDEPLEVPAPESTTPPVGSHGGSTAQPYGAPPIDLVDDPFVEF